MNAATALLVAALSTIPNVIEKDGVKVEVFVQAQIFLWRVHNTGAEPITHFQVYHRNCYTQVAPPGWLIELSEDEQTFFAKAKDPRLAIKPGRYGDFQATVTSHGAALGVVPIKLTTADGSTIEMEVWGPIKMPRRAVLTVVLTVCGVAFLHARIVGRKQRRRA